MNVENGDGRSFRAFLSRRNHGATPLVSLSGVPPSHSALEQSVCLLACLEWAAERKSSELTEGCLRRVLL